jgi:DNA-binding transcriptional MerR regulator
VVQTILRELAGSPTGTTSLDSLTVIDGVDIVRLKRWLTPGATSHYHPPLRWTPGTSVVSIWRCSHPSTRGSGSCGGRATIYVPCPEVIAAGATVLCHRCLRPPVEDAAQLFFPESYRLPYDRSDERLSIRDGAGLPHPADRLQPRIERGGLPEPTYFIGDAARLLEVSSSVLRSWANSGAVGSTRVGRNRVFTHTDLTTATVKQLVADYRARAALWVTASEAARLLDVDRASVDRLVTTGVLRTNSEGHIRRSNVTQVTDDDLRRASADHDLLTVSECHDVLNLTRKQFNALEATGALKAATRTQGGHRRYRRSDIQNAAQHLADQLGLDGAAALRGEKLMTIADVAAKTGLPTSTVRSVLANGGILPTLRIGTVRIFAGTAVASLDVRLVQALRENIRIGEAARQLGMTTEKLRQLTDAAEIPCVRVGTKGTRYFLAEELAETRSP